MADDILDIIHRITYEIQGQQKVDNVKHLFEQNAISIGKNTASLARLQQALDSTTDPAKQARIQQAMQNRVAAIQKEQTAIQNTILYNKQYQQSLQAEMGILGSLEARLKALQIARQGATSKADIQRYNNDIQAIQKEQQILLGLTGGGKGLLSTIGGGITQGLGIAGGMGIANVIANSIGALKQFGVESFQAAANFEQLKVAFATMTGSEAAGNKLLTQIQDFAQITPYGTTALTELSKQLLAYGIGADDIIPTIDMLGNVAAGVGKDKMPQLILAFGQIRAAGKLTGQDLLQLINAGFNPLQIISEKTGQSMTKLKDDMSKGLITFKQVENAFKTATSEGGKFHNLMQNQSRTTAGRLDAMGDSVEKLKIAIGNNLTPAVGNLINGFTSLIENVTGYLELNPAAEIERERIEVNALAESIKGAADGSKLRNDLIAQMNSKYPDFLNNLSAESITNGDIARSQERVNSLYRDRIALMGKEQYLNSIKTKSQKGYNDLAEISGVFGRIAATDPNNELAKYAGNPQDAVRYLSSLSPEQRLGLINQNPSLKNALEKLYDQQGGGFLTAPITSAANLLTGNTEAYKMLEIALKDGAAAIENIDIALKQAEGVQRDIDATSKTSKEADWIRRANDANVQQARLKQELKNYSKESAEFLRIEADIKKLQVVKDRIRDEVNGVVKSSGDSDTPEAKKEKIPITLKEAVRRAGSIGATVTSTTEGKHNVGSAHYQGRAMDIRTKDRTDEEVSMMIAQFEAMGLKVRDERIRPKGQKVWGGAHLHVSWDKGATWKDGSFDEYDIIKNNENSYKASQQFIQDRYDQIKADDLNVNKLKEAYNGLQKSFVDYVNSAQFLKDTPEQQESIAKSYKSAMEVLMQRISLNYSAIDQQMFKDLQGLASQSGFKEDARKFGESLEKEIDKSNSIWIDVKVKVKDLTLDRSNMNQIMQSLNPLLLQNFSDAFDVRMDQRRQDANAVFTSNLTSGSTAFIGRVQKDFEKEQSDKKKAESEEAKRRKERQDTTIWGAQEVSSAIVSIAQQELDMKMRLIDAEIEYRERRMDKARELAERGNIEALQREQAQLDELYKKREDAGRKQIALNQIITASELAKAAAEMAGAIASIASGGDAYSAAFRIAASAAAMVAGIMSIKNAIGQMNTGQYYTGGYTGDGGKYDAAGTVHKGEFVFDQDKTKQFRPLFEAIHSNKIKLGDFAMPPKIAMPEIYRPEVASQREMRELKAEMIGVKDAINNISVDATQKMDRYGLMQSVEFVKRQDRNRFRK